MFRLLIYIIMLFLGGEVVSHRDYIKRPAVIAQLIETDTLDLLEFFRPFRRVIVSSSIEVPYDPIMESTKINGWTAKDFQVTARYSYGVRAIVLGKEHYLMGRESELSNYDLALGWQQMSDPSVLGLLDITQSHRWYYYHWNGNPPLSPEQIPLQSGNMHIIPGNTEVELTLAKIHKGDIITLVGYLVNVAAPDGWKWETGTSPSAEGAHGCKLIWVEKLLITKRGS